MTETLKKINETYIKNKNWFLKGCKDGINVYSDNKTISFKYDPSSISKAKLSLDLKNINEQVFEAQSQNGYGYQNLMVVGLMTLIMFS